MTRRPKTLKQVAKVIEDAIGLAPELLTEESFFEVVELESEVPEVPELTAVACLSAFFESSPFTSNTCDSARMPLLVPVTSA